MLTRRCKAAITTRASGLIMGDAVAMDASRRFTAGEGDALGPAVHTNFQ